jgi:hypothetical protein
MSDTFQKYAVQILDINMTFMCQMLTSLVTTKGMCSEGIILHIAHPSDGKTLNNDIPST